METGKKRPATAAKKKTPRVGDKKVQPKFMDKVAPSQAMPKGVVKPKKKPNSSEDVLEEAMQNYIDKKKPRQHLGLSKLRDPDERTVWLDYRWCLPDDIKPRNERIFRLGHLIESEVIELLNLMPNMQVHDVDPKTKQQYNFSALGGHLGGSLDSILLGVPEAPTKPVLFECKSAKASKWRDLNKLKSVKLWNATYYGQIQDYMNAFELEGCLYIVYNKDTSELYFEFIKIQQGHLLSSMKVAERIIGDEEPVESIYTRSSYELKNFKSEEYQRIYWRDQLPKKNCRNCKHAQAHDDGHARWYCLRHDQDLTIKRQRAGCKVHLYMPYFFNGKLLEDHGDIMRYETLKGVEVWNAEDATEYPDAHVYSSDELYALSKQGLLDSDDLEDKVMNDLISRFDGEIFES